MNNRFPLGIDDFAEIRENGYYYVDKTVFIKELLNKQFKANLVTRPRRFGKTLTMSMLEDFFDISRDSRAHFAGLEVAQDTALCEKWMNRYPTVFLTLKGAEGLNFDSAYARLKILISTFARSRQFLLESDRVSEGDKEDFRALCRETAPREKLTESFLLFARMLQAHYGKPVILLIDEYDVPLAKASENGYYAEMLDVIRSLLGGAIKTNPHLKFAVITGCLRISKESIFTGINNLVVDAITGGSFGEHIGFTQKDVDKILEDTNLLDHREEIRAWYDGYRFGKINVYCPWSVLSHASALQDDPTRKPREYWGNTSSNGVIYTFISRRNVRVKKQLETLLAGGVIVTDIEEALTYDTLHSSEKNFWSLLYLTGYLTNADVSGLEQPLKAGQLALRIPNGEVRNIFQKTIVNWFNDYVVTIDRQQIFTALWNGDTETAQDLISNLLFRTISYHDYQESFYHAFLAGLFAGQDYMVESNYEYGRGRPDVVVMDDETRRAMVLEIKHARSEGEIGAKCEEAVRQIAERKYLDGIERGYRNRIAYGVVFFEKDCYIVKAGEQQKNRLPLHGLHG